MATKKIPTDTGWMIAKETVKGLPQAATKVVGTIVKNVTPPVIGKAAKYLGKKLFEEPIEKEYQFRKWVIDKNKK